jgi:DNA polymerase-3 subunit beta
MKILVDRAQITQVLQKIQNVTERKTNMPILSHVLIKADAESLLQLSATDLELSVRAELPATIEEPGNITVSAKKLLDIVRELPQSQVTLETNLYQRLVIQTGRAKFELATIPWEDFPRTSFYEDVTYANCDAGLLYRCLSRTWYAIPAEEESFAIAGLYLHVPDNDTLRFASTDGHRLAHVKELRGSFDGVDVGTGIVIPRKGVQEILRAIDKESHVLLAFHENCLMLKTESLLLSVQLLEAEFPNYQMIIPEERPFHFDVEWESFHAALKRMAILTDHKWRHVRFNLRGGMIELESGSHEIGMANEVLDVQYEGADFSVAFNIRYVIDAIQPLEGQQVRFEWVDSDHGGVFMSPEDPSYLGLIMPMVV